MTHIPICPHCGQADEENAELARGLPKNRMALIRCGCCDGAYLLTKKVVFDVEKVCEE